MLRRMGREKTRSFFTRFCETHQPLGPQDDGFRQNARNEERAFCLYPSYGVTQPRLIQRPPGLRNVERKRRYFDVERFSR